MHADPSVSSSSPWPTEHLNVIRTNKALRVAASSIFAILAAATVSGCASSTADHYQTLGQEAASSGFVPERFGSNPPLIGMLRAKGYSHNQTENQWVVIEGARA